MENSPQNVSGYMDILQYRPMI